MTWVASADNIEDLLDWKGGGLEQMRCRAKLEILQIFSWAYTCLATEQMLEIGGRDSNGLGQFGNRKLTVGRAVEHLQGSLDSCIQQSAGLGFQLETLLSRKGRRVATATCSRTSSSTAVRCYRPPSLVGNQHLGILTNILRDLCSTSNRIPGVQYLFLQLFDNRCSIRSTATTGQNCHQ
jgi:hypothetical protein